MLSQIKRNSQKTAIFLKIQNLLLAPCAHLATPLLPITSASTQTKFRQPQGGGSTLLRNAEQSFYPTRCKNPEATDFKLWPYNNSRKPKLTSRRRGLLATLVRFRLVKKHRAFYGSQRLTAIFKRSRQLYLSSARSTSPSTPHNRLFSDLLQYYPPFYLLQ